MAFAVTIEASHCPGRSELAAACEAATWANARWYLEQWKRGKDPACCLDCIRKDLRYRPDRPSETVKLATGDVLMSKRVGSCGELAALEAGRLRAAAIREGASQDAAANVAHVELVATDPKTFHAIVRLANGGSVDPTEGMRRG